MNILGSISRSLMIPEETLGYLIRTAPFRYKVFKVEKRNGKGKRTIAQPAREVKDLQYWVMEKILHNFPIHSAATAYRAGRSITTNAAKHAPNHFLLKMDFKDFFNSIRSDDLDAYLRKLSSEEWGDKDIEYLKRILFWDKERRGRLVMSIGAPSSPMLSNILLYDFDRRVQAFCTPRRVRYSRYADDLAFSTNKPNVLREVEVEVVRICKRMRHPKLTVNAEKTVHASARVARRVTGLVLTNEGSVSLGRDRKRLIRAQIHRFLMGGLNLEEKGKLRGMLAFVNSAEPSFIEKLRDHYGSAEIDKIFKMSD